MKIANAPTILAVQQTRSETAKLLAAGETVVVHAGDAAVPALSPELLRTISLGGGAIASMHLTPAVRTQLDMQGIALGVGGGALVGAGIGIVLQQIKQLHPTSGVVLDAACAMIGAGLGAMVGSGKVEVEPCFDEGKFSMKVRAVTPKGS